jgi:integrase
LDLKPWQTEQWMTSHADSGRLSVTQSLVTVAHRLEFSQPKTKKSRRSVSLDPATVVGLRAHRAQSLEERLAMGAGWHGSDLVFTWPDGKPIHPDVVSRTFDRLSRRAGLPRIRFHDIRHSYATAALSPGLPAKVVSSRLGHSSISVTSDIYTHVMPEHDEEAAARVADLILQQDVSNP